ncbi:MAG: MBL fold metallo-hydrolase [Chlorobi bacterium]|nr:MBL fold metallo-hydrolase [Chlorobiota bacterium]
MTVYILSENTASPHFLAEHGLSRFIEHKGKKILFDTGASDVFLKNAKKFNLNIDEADMIILSHGHWDHGNGLKYLKSKPLIAHPGIFKKRYGKKTSEYIGINSDFDELNAKFKLNLSSKPVKITEQIIFLGEIPRLNDFEAQTTDYIDDKGHEDFVIDDSALALIQNGELIIITACSHSGVCNIIEYAKKVTGINTVKAITGGFHLKYRNSQTFKTIECLKKQKIKHIMPSHCTMLPALTAFYDEFAVKQIKTGMKLNF